MIFGPPAVGKMTVGEELCKLIARAKGGRTRFVELYAALDERLDRKPSKRDLDFSRANLLKVDRDYVMNTDETTRVRAQDLIEQHDHLRIDNIRLPAAETAALIQRWMPQ